MKEIAEVDPEELVRILEIEKEKALEIVQRASEMVQGKKALNRRKRVFPSPILNATPSDQIEGVGEKTAEILRANGFQDDSGSLEGRYRKTLLPSRDRLQKG